MKTLLLTIFLGFVLFVSVAVAFVIGDIDFMKMDRSNNAVTERMPYPEVKVLVVRYHGDEAIKLVWIESREEQFARYFIVIKVAYYKEKVLKVYYNNKDNTGTFTGEFTQKFDTPAKEKAIINKDLADAKVMDKTTGSVWYTEWDEGSLHKITY